MRPNLAMSLWLFIHTASVLSNFVKKNLFQCTLILNDQLSEKVENEKMRCTCACMCVREIGSVCVCERDTHTHLGILKGEVSLYC